MFLACQNANVSYVTFYKWRKENPRLDDIIANLYDSRITIVEDALFKNAIEGNVTAQIFFLKARAKGRWHDERPIEPGIVKVEIYKINDKGDKIPEGVIDVTGVPSAEGRKDDPEVDIKGQAGAMLTEQSEGTPLVGGIPGGQNAAAAG